MTRLVATALIPLLAAVACSAPPPPSPPSPPPLLPGREPVSPPGTEGLRASPCSRRFDLSPSSAAQRAFSPAEGALSARTTLPFRVRGETPSRAWSSSRPEAVRFVEGAAGAITLVAGQPGTTLVRLTAADPEAEEASVLVSVPMFVAVREDATFGALLARDLGLAGREREIMTEAKRVIASIYARANLRVAFQVGLGEEIPAELPNNGFIEATLHGDLRKCVTPQSSLLNTEFGGYGEGDGAHRLERAPVHVCPGIFVRHPDTMAAVVKSRQRLLAEERGARLYVAIVGRAIGELLAHEVGHQLLGCDNRGERRHWRCHDRSPSSLMNKAGERSFADRTGIAIEPTQYSTFWRDDFPAEGTYEDRGVEGINRLLPRDQAVLDRILPVPPALAEMVPCP